MSVGRWSVTEHRGPEGLAAIKADWRRLYLAMPNAAMWHSFEAYSAYLQHLCPDPQGFRCFALSDGERVRAILPIEERLERDLGLPVRVWGMPWRQQGGWLTTDAIGPEDDARRALLPLVIERLHREPGRPAMLVLGRTRSASVLWDGLAELPSSRWFAFADGGESVMPTDMPVQAFMARLKSKSRNSPRKAARDFEALEGAEYVHAVEDPGLSSEFERFLDVEASGWKGERGSAVTQQPELAAFYRDLLERLSTDGHCEIHSLHAESRCIASALCVYTRRQCAVYKSGYDERYARVSPGLLNNQKTLERCCEDPVVDVVSEVSDAPWLHRWVPHTYGIQRAYVSLRPVSGALLLPALRLRYGPVRTVTRKLKAWRRDHDGRTSGRRGRDAVALDADQG